MAGGLLLDAGAGAGRAAAWRGRVQAGRAIDGRWQRGRCAWRRRGAPFPLLPPLPLPPPHTHATLKASPQAPPVNRAAPVQMGPTLPPAPAAAGTGRRGRHAVRAWRRRGTACRAGPAAPGGSWGGAKQRPGSPGAGRRNRHWRAPGRRLPSPAPGSGANPGALRPSTPPSSGAPPPSTCRLEAQSPVLTPLFAQTLAVERPLRAAALTGKGPPLVEPLPWGGLVAPTLLSQGTVHSHGIPAARMLVNDARTAWIRASMTMQGRARPFRSTGRDLPRELHGALVAILGMLCLAQAAQVRGLRCHERDRLPHELA